MIGFNVFKKEEGAEMKFSNFFSFLICLFVFSGMVYGKTPQDNKGMGTLPGEAILFRSPDARSLALGDAYSAVANGSESMYWNPAGLGKIKSVDINVSALNDDVESMYGNVSLAFKIKGIGVLGVSGSVYDHSEGFIERDKDANKIENSELALQENVLSVGYGSAVPLSNEWLYFGIVGKQYTGNIVNEASVGYIDFGFLLDMPVINFSFGMQNIGLEKVKYNEVEEDLPTNMRVGMSLELIGFLLSADGNYRIEGNREVYGNFGFEYRIPLIAIGVSLRGGYTTRNKEGIESSIYEVMDGVRAGIGLDIAKVFRLDVAWVPNENIGDALAVSIAVGF